MIGGALKSDLKCPRAAGGRREPGTHKEVHFVRAIVDVLDTEQQVVVRVHITVSAGITIKVKEYGM